MNHLAKGRRAIVRWLSPRRRLEGVLRRTVRGFTADRRGGTAVQAMVIMPVIIIATFGLFKAWEVVQVRESVHTGTYEATRYLSLYPPENPDTLIWSDIARRMIENELKNNPWIGRYDLFPANLHVDVTFDGSEYACKMNFILDVTFDYAMPNIDPLPGVTFKLIEKRDGEILCQ